MDKETFLEKILERILGIKEISRKECPKTVTFLGNLYEKTQIEFAVAKTKVSGYILDLLEKKGLIARSNGAYRPGFEIYRMTDPRIGCCHSCL